MKYANSVIEQISRGKSEELYSYKRDRGKMLAGRLATRRDAPPLLPAGILQLQCCPGSESADFTISRLVGFACAVLLSPHRCALVNAVRDHCQFHARGAH